MIGKRLLRKETLGILTTTRTATEVPKGAIIDIKVAPSPDARMVDVVWDGKILMMFVRDLQDRSEAISSRAASD
jgi:hypothetical protein